jgi:hypothetical protein
VCRKTSIKLKSKITKKLLNQKYRKIGGNEKVVQIDETVICRGRLILTHQTNWMMCLALLGLLALWVIDKVRGLCFIVPNRKMETVPLYLKIRS